MRLVLFLLVAISLQIYQTGPYIFNPIHLLRSFSDRRAEELNCLSWRLAVETNSRQDWKIVPEQCKDYISEYMQGKGEQYRRDCEEVAAAAIEFAKKYQVGDDGKDVWVFDIDETTLSNLGYYNRSDVQYGTKARNKETFFEWMKEGKGKGEAVPGMLNLYNTLLSLKFKTVILTAVREEYKEVRETSLKAAGYGNWLRLIFRRDDEQGRTYKSTKRTELVNEGYRIVGNVGDQWSDLSGPNGGIRMFKVPNPMYYV